MTEQSKVSKFEMSITEYEDINALITEYLRAQGMHKTASTIEQEIKSIWSDIKISM